MLLGSTGAVFLPNEQTAHIPREKQQQQDKKRESESVLVVCVVHRLGPASQFALGGDTNVVKLLTNYIYV